MTEYSQINMGIDKEWLLSCIPECWSAFVTLKAEYYKGMKYLLTYFFLSITVIIQKDKHFMDYLSTNFVTFLLLTAIS